MLKSSANTLPNRLFASSTKQELKESEATTDQILTKLGISEATLD